MKTKTVASMAMMIAVIIVLGFIPPIPLGIIPVPIILQNMGIMLAGALLGAKRGFLAVLIFLFLAALGLPVLSGGHGNIAVFMGPSAGYLFAYPFAAGLIGFVTEKTGNRRFVVDYLLIWLIGVLFIDSLGALGLSIQSHMPLDKAFWANLVFIPGDSLKVLMVTLLYRRFKTA
ncbi:biotin transporter BioY [Streptococcus macacae]|uniref:Biotin transporter n=1 Tax=Streptococcus macacae NCTC 11558 TaxID=764298 RepID=G5JXD1_9STRE|nr:biotin transporter BioY [Streptococcus macacae]EHJ52112.1 BioY family protein [Streptococcus macacae NCTC 11558]SUN79178.1 biotin biosynthesis protein [Streptococcus macacae NCTC 11558]